MKISAVIITYNEEQNIGDCLRSLWPVADELLVLDSYSSDRTVEVARQHGARVEQHKFDGHIEQKNRAMKMAKYDFVLSLDADERLSKALQESIENIKENPEAEAYVFNRLNNYCGKWIRHSGWYPDRKTRLWNRAKGRWGGQNPHDQVLMKEGTTVKRMRGDILHYSYRSSQEHQKQMDTFAEISARGDYQKGKRANRFLHLVLYPGWVFLYNYIFRLGFLDGRYGFVVCVNSARYRHLKYLKLWKIQNENPARKHA